MSITDIQFKTVQVMTNTFTNPNLTDTKVLGCKADSVHSRLPISARAKSPAQKEEEEDTLTIFPPFFMVNIMLIPSVQGIATYKSLELDKHLAVARK